MKPFLYSLAFILSLAANAQAPYYKFGPDSIPAYPFGVTQLDTTVKVVFKVIDSTAFIKYKKAYKTELNTDSTQVEWLDTTFVVHAGAKKFTKQYRKKDGQWNVVISVYRGYLKSLNLYVIDDIDGNNEMDQLSFINKTTGKYYVLYPRLDNSSEIPMISPKGNYVLTWDADMYEHWGSGIELYTVNRGKDGIVLTNFWSTSSDPIASSDDTLGLLLAERDKSLWYFPEPEVPDSIRYADGYSEPVNYEYSKWLIKDLVWASNTSFAFKIYRVYYDEQKGLQVYTPYKYVLGSFKQ